MALRSLGRFKKNSWEPATPYSVPKNVFDGFAGEVLILSGDVPLIKEETLRAMVARHRSRQAVVDIAHGGA